MAFLAFRLLRGGFLAPVSGGDFPISVSARRRPVLIFTETGGFEEEREWRAIYTPKRAASPLIISSTEVIGGVPQISDALVSELVDDFVNQYRKFFETNDPMVIAILHTDTS